MKTLYLDLFSGISGDMFIGALVDLGVDAHKLEKELGKLKLGGYHLHVGRKTKMGIDGVKFDVHLHEVGGEKGEGRGHTHHEHVHAHHGDKKHSHEHFHKPGAEHQHDHDHGHDHHHGHGHEHGHDCHDHEHGENRTFAEIRKLITKSTLSAWVKKKSIGVFQRIAVAEGKIHGMPPDKVHFHEVGAVDSIVDIVGGCIALELLGKPRVVASNVTEGVGWVDCAHGRFPVPAPATLAILGARGAGVTQCEEPHELVTPTGAALVAELAESFGPMQGLVAEKVGFGLGTRDNKTRPNVLRVVLGETSNTEHRTSNIEKSGSGKLDWETDRIAVLETNLDDISGEVLGNFVEQALKAGALDVFHTPIQMKKNRPGVLLSVLCAEAEADKFSELMLRETSAFGVRRTVAERRKLRREFVSVKTKFGVVTVKVGKLNGKVVQAAPEYEVCRKLAEQAKVPVKVVFEAAGKALKR